MTPAVTELRFACAADQTEFALPLPDGTVHHLTLPPCGAADEEHAELLPGGAVRVRLRRVHCVVSDALLRLGDPAWGLSAAARAGLLWRAYRRYAELVGLKKLAGGLSASDVLVFRPRLKPPAPNDDPDLVTAGPADVLAGAWGAPLLVKTGPEGELRKEWARFDRFLRDRQSPFVAHQEELLTVRPPGPAPVPARAVLVSSFLGGDVVRVEPLDKVIRGTRDADRCLRLLDGVFAHLGTWHTNPSPRPLADWARVFYPAAPAAGAPRWLLFGRYNFRKETQASAADWDAPRKGGEPSLGRHEFAARLRWDVPFGKKEHLNRHLLGKGQAFDGLLPALMKLEVPFSLIHGDLNPRNVLCDADNTWLIDFEHTGVGPLLADFARLEVNLRFWCVALAEPTANIGQVAEELERLLLAHFHGCESSLEPVRQLAPGLGADPDDLAKIARCIVHVRKLARRWCASAFVDGRDYLAVLYLTLLGLLPAASQPGKVPHTNLRWGMGLYWVLEEALDRVLGRPPFDREQQPYDPLRHLSAGWLEADGAAGRAHYLCETADGREVLAPVVALKGVLQGGYHHLDAYHHTLAVLTYLEELLRDPVDGLLNPQKLDAAVAARLAEFGLPPVPLIPEQVATPVTADWLTADAKAAVSALLRASLTESARLLLKWCALLHDVGKPGTRTTREKGTVREVQFIGHEVYGLSLLQDRLEAWFPADDRERLADLIRNHHRSHQLVGDYLLKPAGTGTLGQLRTATVAQPEPELLRWLSKLATEAQEEYRPDLALLLLHGYADRLAARGVKQSQPVAEWAEATLALLAGLVAFPALSAAADAAAARENAAEAVVLAYATELRDAGLLDAKSFGRAMGILKSACAGREGSGAELGAYLRAHWGIDKIRLQLGVK